jgi:DNA (cytosine-5)-methyltransferase 1
MPTDAVLNKIRRLRRGGAPRVLDLFSGCGGLSLGFQRAGYNITASIELDADAARSHAANFHGGDTTHAAARDITQVSPRQLVRKLGLGDPASAFDVIVGGPPCQAFARVGRPKLREVFDHPEAFTRDPRAQLYLEYLHYISALQPLAILMENVPDVLNHAGHNIAQEFCDVLSEQNFVCGYTLLNASWYGVPQMRERMFLIAYRKETGAAVSFPAPRNWLDLPSGYESSRAVALKHMNGLARSASDYVDPPAARKSRPAAITAEEAIGDLPPIFARRELASGVLKRGTRHFDKTRPWDPSRKPSRWAAGMRHWPGFEADPAGVRDHVIRYLPRDYSIFARMRAGDQYPQALAIANRLFANEVARLQRARVCPREGSAAWHRIHAAIVPPYDAGKFPNKWRKMWRDEPARTLMAHLGKDSYSHIHYDSSQARPISVREAARLQSFPDGFAFSGAMNSAFRQIGNAVPPLMAFALGEHMLATLRTSRKANAAVGTAA